MFQSRWQLRRFTAVAAARVLGVAVMPAPTAGGGLTCPALTTALRCAGTAKAPKRPKKVKAADDDDEVGRDEWASVAGRKAAMSAGAKVAARASLARIMAGGMEGLVDFGDADDAAVPEDDLPAPVRRAMAGRRKKAAPPTFVPPSTPLPFQHPHGTPTAAERALEQTVDVAATPMSVCAATPVSDMEAESALGDRTGHGARGYLAQVLRRPVTHLLKLSDPATWIPFFPDNLPALRLELALQAHVQPGSAAAAATAHLRERQRHMRSLEAVIDFMAQMKTVNIHERQVRELAAAVAASFAELDALEVDAPGWLLGGPK
jgi:hypothetical protein